MDLLVRALEEKPHPRHVAPRVTVIDRESVRGFDATTSLPPRGFRPCRAHCQSSTLKMGRKPRGGSELLASNVRMLSRSTTTTRGATYLG